MKKLKIIIEKHADGYVAYPVGIKGVVVGEGDSYDEALTDVKSAIAFHLETFGPESLDLDEPVLEAFVAETAVQRCRSFRWTHPKHGCFEPCRGWASGSSEKDRTSR